MKLNMKNIDEILRYFPNKIYQIFFNLFQENSKIAEELQEIRMRAERPIILKLRERDLILQYNITQAEILQIVERLCENSIYAYKNQICSKGIFLFSERNCAVFFRCGRKMTFFVKFVVIRNVGLGHNTQNFSFIKHRGTVIKP